MVICPHCQTVNHAANVACSHCGAPLASDPAFEGDPYVGRVLAGRFVLQSVVGSGDIGMVYRGVDRRSGQEVAIKIVHPDVAATHGDALLRSASALAQIRHAKISAVFGASREPDGTTFIVAEFLVGETLKAVLERTGPLGPRRAADILFQLCSALAPIHRAGRPHANLKPENVFLVERPDGSDFVKIVDAGSPELFGVRETPAGRMLIGTPKYFSPEQALGLVVTTASDQFALGIIGYQLLTGALPFFGATPEQILSAIAYGQPTPVGQRTAGVTLPGRLEGVIHRCLSKTPEERFPELRSLATELAAVIKSAPAGSAAPAPVPAAPAKKKPFGAGRDLSTVVASADMLASLSTPPSFAQEANVSAEYDDDDEDRTVMRSVGDSAWGSGGMSAALAAASAEVSAPPRSSAPPAPRGAPPPPPSRNDLASIPEPLMFTGALDSADIKAALSAAAAATAERRAGTSTRGGPTPRPSSPPRPSAPPKPAAPAVKVKPNDDLMAAMASAIADVGGAPGAFDPFGDAERAATPASLPPPGPSMHNAGAAHRSDIMGAIEEELTDPQTTAAKPVPAPLATAADFAALSPEMLARAAAAAASVEAESGRSSGGSGRAGVLIAAAVLLLGGAGATWFFLFNDPTPTIRPSPPGQGHRVAGPAVDPQPDPSADAPVAGDGGAAEVAAPAVAPDAAVAAAPPQKLDRPRLVRIESQPHARVFYRERDLGETPVDLVLDTDELRTYTLRRPGFAEMRHQINPTALPATGVPKVERFELTRQDAVAERRGKPTVDPTGDAQRPTPADEANQVGGVKKATPKAPENTGTKKRAVSDQPKKPKKPPKPKTDPNKIRDPFAD